MSKRLEKVVEIAREGGKLALAMQKDLSRSEKDDGSVVTDADIAVQRLVTKALRDAFPDYGIVGEEEGLVQSGGHLCVFVVDPIDGTHSYQRGFPHYGVSIGLVEKDQCTLGVFYNPALDNMYAVDEGEPARLNGQIIKPRTSGVADAPIFMVPSNFHRWYTSNYKGKIRNFGTAAEHLCFLATGQADGLMLYYTYLWDIAAGMALIGSLGCRTAFIDGGEFHPGEYIDGLVIEKPLIFARPGNWNAIAESVSKK